MKVKGKVINLELDFLMHKPKLTIQLENQIDLLTEEFNNIKDKVIDIEIGEHKEKRSLNANSYFHSLINQMARALTIPDDEMKRKMVLQYGTIARNEDGVLGAKVPKGTNLATFYPYCKKYKEENGCDCYLFYKRTSELNTLEFSRLLEGVVFECKELGIRTLEDREIQILIEAYEGEK